ncbi:hypothetical protein F5B22DRAFT_651015 [Xylaria bambusicola]|uniref:uncharacterized protein n=1 Tax=Xylaria bambusicola TaxID=326684 RepID=UPI0020078E2F|nr:uncharacterized protein F5B22DRAFT_651015 [Xylaria bambusicola]KAI0506193.1 hypothetical protein F5B22DRAFT_651015 [Xylaria bambusicola]
MSSPNRIDGGRLAPPSSSKGPIRNGQNLTQSTIMIEPTAESQRFYNQNRREMDRQRLELHVEENNLEPPMSELSTASDSHPSPSTVCSQSGNSVAPCSPDPAAEATRSKPHRGRRKGPLDMETRTKTAFKRKFKLTCAFHRAKRTSCNCHDFSKLEEGYRKFCAAEEQKARASSRGGSARPFGEGDIETFSTGGGVPPLTTPQYNFSTDLPDLPTGGELTSRVNESLLPALKLDIDSAESVSKFVSTPRDEYYYLAPDATGLVTIGSSTLYPNRWQCDYKFKTEETESLSSAGSCSWTGPLEQLCDHFSTEHHPFQPYEPPEWSICDECKEIRPGWGEQRCHPGRSTKYYYGALPRRAKPNPPRLTVSEASGSRSWLQPSWNMATRDSSNTGQSNFPYSSSTSRSGCYEHCASGNESSESVDGDDEDGMTCAGMENWSRTPSDADDTIPHCRIGIGIGPLDLKMGTRSALYGSNLSLTSGLKPCRRRLIPSLLAPLVTFYLQLVHLLTGRRNAILLFLAAASLMSTSLLLIVVFGPVAAWVAADSLKSRANRRDGLYALVVVV